MDWKTCAILLGGLASFLSACLWTLGDSYLSLKREAELWDKGWRIVERLPDIGGEIKVWKNEKLDVVLGSTELALKRQAHEEEMLTIKVSVDTATEDVSKDIL